MIRKTGIILVALALMMTGGAWAAEPVKVAVFPFDIFSRQPMKNLKGQLQSMLQDRLAKEGIVSISSDKVNQALKKSGKPLDLSLARRLAGQVGADYAVYGSFTQIGSRVSLDLKILDAMGMSRPQSAFVQGSELSSLPSLIDKLAAEVSVKVSGRAKVAKINIEGSGRIEPDAVKEVLTLKEGGPFSNLILDRDVRAVWKMGYFKDVRAKVSDSPQGKVITFQLKEKPTIREVKIEGNDEIDTKDLRDQIGIKPFSVYKPGLIKDAEAKIVKLYHDKGYYNVEVKSQVFDLPNGNKGLKFAIKEGDKVFIKTINFSGAKAFDKDTLLDQMSTQEDGLFSWFTDDNILDRAKLEQDREKLSDYYYNNGYLESRIGEPIIKKGEDGLIVTFNIVEGARYKVSSVGLSGEMIKPKKEMMKFIQTKAGNWFSREKVRADMSYLHDLYADRGYAFVQVRPNVKRDPANHTVAIAFDVRKGRKVWFERILITGNTRTRDNVIRRQLGVAEGDQFSSRALRNSNMRLQKLRFFEDVHISTSKGSSPDRMDLKINVKEKRTGNFSAGAGYSTEDSLMLMGSISESNLFGRGQKLEFRAQLGGVSTRYNLSFTEPWLFDLPISFGVDIYDWRREYTNYDKESVGGRIRFGFPTGLAYTRLYTYYKYEVSDVSGVSDSASIYVKDQEGEYTTSSLKFVLRRDTKNHAFNTTDGSDNSLSLEYAGGVLGGTNAFIKAIGESGWYFPLWFSHTFVVHGRVGWLEGHSDGKLPIYERFFLGGINTLRGFDYWSVGPKDPATGDVIGGERMAQLNVEYRFPLVAKAGLIGLVFYDTGNTWLKEDGYDFDNMRSSAGGGVRWYSPLGPLRLEYGYVLDPEPGEAKDNWEFTIGGLF